MATLLVDYDSVQTLYKMNSDNETAQMLPVLGKKAYDNAIADGWQVSVPKLNYPCTLYQKDGSTKIAQDRADEEMWMADHLSNCDAHCKQHGWNHTVTAAPPTPAENFGPLVEPKATDETVKLALALLESNQRIEELRAMIEKLAEKKGFK